MSKLGPATAVVVFLVLTIVAFAPGKAAAVNLAAIPTDIQASMSNFDGPENCVSNGTTFYEQNLSWLSGAATNQDGASQSSPIVVAPGTSITLTLNSLIFLCHSSVDGAPFYPGDGNENTAGAGGVDAGDYFEPLVVSPGTYLTREAEFQFETPSTPLGSVSSVSGTNPQTVEFQAGTRYWQSGQATTLGWTAPGGLSNTSPTQVTISVPVVAANWFDEGDGHEVYQCVNGARQIITASTYANPSSTCAVATDNYTFWVQGQGSTTPPPTAATYSVVGSCNGDGTGQFVISSNPAGAAFYYSVYAGGGGYVAGEAVVSSGVDIYDTTGSGSVTISEPASTSGYNLGNGINNASNVPTGLNAKFGPCAVQAPPPKPNVDFYNECSTGKGYRQIFLNENSYGTFTFSLTDTTTNTKVIPTTSTSAVTMTIYMDEYPETDHYSLKWSPGPTDGNPDPLLYYCPPGNWQLYGELDGRFPMACTNDVTTVDPKAQIWTQGTDHSLGVYADNFANNPPPFTDDSPNAHVQVAVTDCNGNPIDPSTTNDFSTLPDLDETPLLSAGEDCASFNTPACSVSHWDFDSYEEPYPGLDSIPGSIPGETQGQNEGTLSFDLSSTATGALCFTAWATPSSDSAPAPPLYDTGGEESSTVCYDIVTPGAPNFTTTGGDIQAGGVAATATNNCTNSGSDSGILNGSQFGSLSLADYIASAAGLINNLTSRAHTIFGNESQNGEYTDICRPNLALAATKFNANPTNIIANHVQTYGAKVSGVTQTPFGATATNGTMYTHLGDLTITGAQTVSHTVTLYVQGSVTISGNITLSGNCTGHVCPSFGLIATGSITILPAVKQLSGYYSAGNNSSGQNGIISDGLSTNVLTVSGFLQGTNIDFQRYCTVATADCTAETVNMTGNLYVSTPPAFDAADASESSPLYGGELPPLF